MTPSPFRVPFSVFGFYRDLIERAHRFPLVVARKYVTIELRFGNCRVSRSGPVQRG
ncbi:hypothetical protein THIOKS11720011 [Thiocapsa sp. KS1]|nr:hypothetical protein THIOKS11720011 [Thiocapsa sp. KS1]